MRNVVIKSGTLSAASTLHARRRRANDNAVDVPMAAGAEVCGDFTPVVFDGVGAPYATVVVRASRKPGASTIEWSRCIASDSELPVSNANHPGTFDDPRSAGPLGWALCLWSALRRQWSVRRAQVMLESMSDQQLSDIGVQRGDIHFIVRHGRDAQPRRHVS